MDPSMDPQEVKGKEKDSSVTLVLGVLASALISMLLFKYGFPAVTEQLVSWGIISQANLDALNNVVRESQPPQMSAEQHRDIIQKLLKPPADTFIEPTTKK
jgi:hypothetical protein